ncbi:MAG: transcriptional regulator GcvA [Sneathiella sp.]
MPSDPRIKAHNNGARLPSLKSIQAFEAAARHLSFKAAAEELHVTPTAISHQIKTLEDQLNVKLFHRLNRSLRLTAAGEIYAPFAFQAFQKLREGSHALQSDDINGQIVISTTRSFASEWLGPRLHRFQSLFSDLTVRLVSSDEVGNFASDGIDVSIRYGFGDTPDMHTAWILDDYVTPVCAPGFSIDPGTPQDLLKHPLIHYEWKGFSQADPSWSKWFQSVGIHNLPLAPQVTYTDEIMCLQAAKDGRGIALVSLITAAEYLNKGYLVPPYPSRLKNKSYFLTCPQSTHFQAKVRAFQDWILDEADMFRDSEVGQRFLEPPLKD